MDVKTFSGHINKSKRKMLARRLAAMSDRARIVAVQGWSATMKPRGDGGGMIVIVVHDSADKAYPLRLVLDDCNSGRAEQCHAYPLRPDTAAELADMLAPYAPTLFPAPPQSESKKFAGWKGGRPKRVLSADEKAAIDKARAAGNTIDEIAKTMHISNRVVSAYCKMSK